MKTLGIVAILLVSVVVGSAQTDIRKVDFKNFTYLAHCLGETPTSYKVKDGEYYWEKKEDGYTDRLSLTITDIAYGDLTGDGRDEAVILSLCNTGGTGQFSEGYIYSMKAGKATLVGRIAGGDRAYGGLRSAEVVNGLLVVETNDVGTEGANCCPQYILTTRYKLAAGKLVKQGKEDRREVYPKERVKFAAGASGTTIKATIPSGEGRRYIVGARSGQTLTASIDTDKASVRVLDDDVESKSLTNGVSAKLSRNGDHTIEVQNDSDSPVVVTVTIKIQ